MSKKDFLKGIEAQAKIQAKREQKVEKGMQVLEEKLEDIAEGQDAGFELVDVVLHDVADMQNQALYGLTSGKQLKDLDITEQRVLAACIYTMLSKQEPKSDLQISFYLNLEDYLGIRERNDKFVFQSLENVDSHSDRIAMGKAICAFLFLRNCSFDFVKDKDSYAWLFDFLPEKEVNRICGTIEQQYRALGKDGITDLYKQLPAAPSQEQIEQKEDIAESQVDVQEVEEEQESIDDFSLLKSIVEDHIEKRDEFGKRVSNYPEIIKKELGKSFPRLSYDAVIGMTKIGNGYLTFTTYAMYVKDGSFIKGEYRCLPYKNIKYTDMAMAEGRSAGTRKIIIPYTDAAGKQTSITIDDSVLTEESLRDLLKDIHESNCNTAETDRFIKLGELNKEQIKEFLSLLTYVLKKNGSSISEVFVLAVFLKLHDEWNSFVDSIQSQEIFASVLSSFKKAVPYPSENVVLKGALHTTLQVMASTNRVAGKESTFVSDAADQLIKELDVKQRGIEAYNKLISGFKNSEPVTSLDNYSFIKQEILNEDILRYEEVEKGIAATIAYLENKAPERIRRAVQEKTAPVAQVIKKGSEFINQAIKPGRRNRSNSGNGKSKSFEYKPRSEDEIVKIPESYSRIDISKLKDAPLPEGAEGYTIATGNASGIVFCYPVTAEASMPLDDSQKIIDFLHETMDENQGIIEVNTGTCEHGGRFIYYLMKYRKGIDAIPKKVGYQLNFNFEIGDQIYFISGSFEEEGITGQRDSMGIMLYIKAKEQAGQPADMGDIMEHDWFCDPYDPEFKKGFLMNRSEIPGLDSTFQAHPLSVARELVKYVTEHN